MAMLGGMPAGQSVMALVWLAVVVLLILAASRAARLLPALRQGIQPSGALALRGSMALDARRRLHLIDAGGHQALVLTGGTTDVVISLPAAVS